MSRHLVDPELAVGLDTNMPAYKLDAETLPTYRQMLLDMVAAIPKPTSEAMINVRRDERFAFHLLLELSLEAYPIEFDLSKAKNTNARARN